jgi:hypothetical protein
MNVSCDMTVQVTPKSTPIRGSSKIYLFNVSDAGVNVGGSVWVKMKDEDIT